MQSQQSRHSSPERDFEQDHSKRKAELIGQANSGVKGERAKIKIAQIEERMRLLSDSDDGSKAGSESDSEF